MDGTGEMGVKANISSPFSSTSKLPFDALKKERKDPPKKDRRTKGPFGKECKSDVE